MRDGVHEQARVLGVTTHESEMKFASVDDSTSEKGVNYSCTDWRFMLPQCRDVIAGGVAGGHAAG